MRSTAFLTAVIFRILSVMALLSACVTDTASWYPSGKASIVSSYETAEDYAKSCAITIRIENTGSSTINSYTISLSAETDIRIYFRTFTDSLTILPGKSAYIDVEISYASATETLKAEGLSVIDEFYQ